MTRKTTLVGRLAILWLLVTLAACGSRALAVSSVSLAWDANTASDLAGYKLHYGSASRNYTQTINVGNVTNAPVAGLQAGVTHFFAVTAYDTGGLESVYSNEVSYQVPLIPNLPPVVNAGGDQIIPLDGLLTLHGSASDDGLPNPPGLLTTTWAMVNGPDTVSFAKPTALVTTVSFALEGFYLLRLTASDGQLSTSQDITIVVTPPQNLGPIITAVAQRSLTSTNVVVTWHTSVLADSEVQFGQTTTYDQFIPIDLAAGIVANHVVSLANLIPNATYHYRVLSRDAAGNLSASADHSFSTPALPTLVSIYIPLAAGSATLSAPMSLSTDPADPTQQFISTSTGNAGSASFDFYVPEAGDYIVWCRVFAPTTLRDSFFVAVDGGPQDIYDMAAGNWTNVWQWTRVNGQTAGAYPRIFTLAAGSHSIVFFGRESASMLNRMIITEDPTFVPADNQPVAGISTAKTLSTTVLNLSLGPGYVMIANQFIHGGNSVAEILPSVPEGTSLFKYNLATRSYSRNMFVAGVWTDPTQTLGPGEGAFFYNSTAGYVDLALTGQIQLNNPPRQFGSGTYLISVPYPRSGPLSQVLDFQPRDGDTIYTFDNTVGGYAIYGYAGGIWFDKDPFIEVAESFWFHRP